jgi:hypothetical protein
MVSSTFFLLLLPRWIRILFLKDRTRACILFCIHVFILWESIKPFHSRLSQCRALFSLLTLANEPSLVRLCSVDFFFLVRFDRFFFFATVIETRIVAGLHFLSRMKQVLPGFILRGIEEAWRLNILASVSLVSFLFNFHIATRACMAVLFSFFYLHFSDFYINYRCMYMCVHVYINYRCMYVCVHPSASQLAFVSIS